ncbi:hypothetical protein L208DRAFT_1397333 [Tricholoma matsutake]|nr:hypothetical protein L208DRAFT_1397333 [Tricholoma matsutake 945]
MKAATLLFTTLFAASGVVLGVTIPRCPTFVLLCPPSDVVETPDGCFKCKDGWDDGSSISQ